MALNVREKVARINLFTGAAGIVVGTSGVIHYQNDFIIMNGSVLMVALGVLTIQYGFLAFSDKIAREQSQTEQNNDNADTSASQNTVS